MPNVAEVLGACYRQRLLAYLMFPHRGIPRISVTYFLKPGIPIILGFQPFRVDGLR